MGDSSEFGEGVTRVNITEEREIAVVTQCISGYPSPLLSAYKVHLLLTWMEI